MIINRKPNGVLRRKIAASSLGAASLLAASHASATPSFTWLATPASNNWNLTDPNRNTGSSVAWSDVAASPNNATFNAASASQTITLSGTYSYGAATAANSGVITGALSLVQNGSGTQTLGDINTYTGSTLVSAGTLSIASTGTINSTSGVTINGSSANFNYNSSTAMTKPITFSGAGGAITGSSTSGGPLAQGASSSNTGLSFQGTAYGNSTLTPSVTTATNATVGGSATNNGTTPVTVNVG